MSKDENRFFSKLELSNLIERRISPIEINRILCAYEMSENVFKNKKTIDGESYFHHLTRVSRILIAELGIYEPDLIISTLLFNILDDDEGITNDIILLNFGENVVYLLNIFKEDINKVISLSFQDLDTNFVSKTPLDDYLLVILAEHLDNFRNIHVSLQYNPINYILNTISNLFPIAEQSKNKKVRKLLSEIKKERNKILG